VRIRNALILLLMVAPSLALASWLELEKSESGYLFRGVAKGEHFSFEVPGNSVQTADDNGRAFVRIDEFVVQVTRVPLPTVPEVEVLDAQRDGEVAYLKDAGATIDQSNICAKLRVPHREWIAIMPDGAISTYLSVRLKFHVLLVVLSHNKGVSGGDTKQGSICSSFVA
jgi:hypothetical protein